MAELRLVVGGHEQPGTNLGAGRYPMVDPVTVADDDLLSAAVVAVVFADREARYRF